MLTGIDAITYGVEDLAQCRKFLGDWGLRKVLSTKHSARFETMDGTEVCLRPMMPNSYLQRWNPARPCVK